MATPSLPLGKKLRYRGEAALFFALMGLFRGIGIDAASSLGGFIGRHVFSRLAPAKTAAENLKAAFPEKSPEEIRKLVIAVCDNLGRVVGEYPHLDKFTFGPGQRVEIVTPENGHAAIARGKGAMFISGHLANWEVMAPGGIHSGYEGGLVYRPPNNPYVAHWINRQRAKLGPQEQISKGAAGTRRIFALLRRGKSIFLLADQKTYEGVAVPFFGRDALTTTAPAALALKLGSALLPASCERLKGAHFRMTIHPALDFTPSGDEAADIKALTALITAKLEDIVRANPAQWLWIHHRWTTQRDIEKMKKLGIKPQA